MYKLFTDGGARSNPGPAACAALLFDESGQLIALNGKYLGTATNNEAEYSGLILGLQLARKANATQLQVAMDSELVIKQVRGEYKVKDPRMQAYCQEVKDLATQFEQIDFVHVLRAQNSHADRLVNLQLDSASK